MGNLLNLFYVGLLILVSPYLCYRRWRTGRYREGLSQKLWGNCPPRSGNAPCLWLHAASVGEVLQIEPVISSWKQQHPDWDIALSVVTQTGMQVARKTYPDCQLFYAPLDFTWSVKKVIARLRPACLVLVELELWPNLIREVSRAGVSLVLINGRLSEKSFRGYRKIRPLIRHLLRKFGAITAQNSDYADRFAALGARPGRLTVSGSIKYDRLV
ncbi:MAG: 3-deoxy-D-manno-octulosonic acid transferase, partial [Planctomycetaceae bacterium]|nr:3-deoxy-D-manno-octulosonic acid transferase [Planctomycetaceae bacterium]